MCNSDAYACCGVDSLSPPPPPRPPPPVLVSAIFFGPFSPDLASHHGVLLVRSKVTTSIPKKMAGAKGGEGEGEL